MKVITKEQKEEIIKLRKQGLTYVSIGKIIGCSQFVAQYWGNAESRKKQKQYAKIYGKVLWDKGIKWQQQNPEKHKKYNREYQQMRYNTDPDFRQKHLDLMKSKNYYNKNESNHLSLPAKAGEKSDR